MAEGTNGSPRRALMPMTAVSVGLAARIALAYFDQNCPASGVGGILLLDGKKSIPGVCWPSRSVVPEEVACGFFGNDGHSVLTGRNPLCHFVTLPTRGGGRVPKGPRVSISPLRGRLLRIRQQGGCDPSAQASAIPAKPISRFGQLGRRMPGSKRHAPPLDQVELGPRPGPCWFQAMRAGHGSRQRPWTMDARRCLTGRPNPRSNHALFQPAAMDEEMILDPRKRQGNWSSWNLSLVDGVRAAGVDVRLQALQGLSPPRSDLSRSRHRRLTVGAIQVAARRASGIG